MKKILVYTAVLLSVVSLGSCTKFLDETPTSNESVANFYKTEADITQAVNAAYNALANGDQYGGNFIYFMEIRSDNTYCESTTNSGGIYGDIDLFRESPYNILLNATWVSCYDGIKRCNVVLDRIGSVAMSKELADKFKGEMLFIRALTYFNLVRLWGEVPLITNYVEDPFSTFQKGKDPVATVMDQIKNDLKEAATLLPKSVDKNRKGAALSGSAKALLGKVYLTLGDYSSAASILKEVIEEGQYKFIDSYAEIFDVTKKNNSESIFEIQYTDAIVDLGSAFANLFAPSGSTELTNGIGKTHGLNMPSEELYKSYENGDLRRDVSVGVIAADGRLYCKKFVKTPVLENQSDANFIVLRYTDVLMMYAEALNETGYKADGDAFKYLNQVRKRAGLSVYSSTDIPTKEAFRDAIAKERRYEFAFENQRWFDLLRTGKAVEVINALGKDYHIDTHNLLYPVPQTQIDIVPGVLVQNNGY